MLDSYLVVNGLPHLDVGGGALDGGVRHKHGLASLGGLEGSHVARSNGGHHGGASNGSHCQEWSSGGAEGTIKK